MKMASGNGVVRQNKFRFKRLLRYFWPLSERMRENLLAVVLCFILILLIIATVNSAPQWIYQNF